MSEKELEVLIDEAVELPIDVDILTAEPEKKTADTKKAAPEAAIEKDGENEAIASLQRQLEEARAEAAREREEKAAAQRQAREFESKSTTATNATLASQLDSVESALSLSQEQAKQAEKDLAAAMEIADYTAAAKAQRVIARTENEIQRLEYGKTELTNRVRRAAEAPPQRQTDPSVDEFVDGIKANSSGPAKAYIERNRGSLKNTKAVNKMIAAHNMAVNSDIVPDSDDYFTFIDSQMGWGEKAASADPAPTTQRTQRSVAAPVSRTTAAANGDLTGNKFRLSAEQAEVARELGISPTAYAKNLMKLQANGKNPAADGLRLSSDLRS